MTLKGGLGGYMLVYIVEDSLDITEVERYALESMEFEVESFERGAEFFDRVKVRKPDIILLDIIVGEESGFDILDKLRESSETKNIPVILRFRSR